MLWPPHTHLGSHATPVFSSRYPIGSKKLQPCTSLDSAEIQCWGRGCFESHGGQLRLTRPPSDSPRPRGAVEPFCQVGSCSASQDALQSAPRGVGCRRRARATQSSCVNGTANLVPMPGSSQLGFTYFITRTRPHPLPPLPLLPPGLSPCRWLIGWSRQLHPRTQMPGSPGQQIQWCVVAENRREPSLRPEQFPHPPVPIFL